MGVLEYHVQKDSVDDEGSGERTPWLSSACLGGDKGLPPPQGVYQMLFSH